MCGILGVFENTSVDARSQRVEKMGRAILHRGPDGSGTWSSADGITLGHRRLAIIDLSPLGHQPMVSASGRFAITFNGEIYNYQELKSKLSSEYNFKGASDTEVLLAGFERWGIEKTLSQAVGMFALGIWDQENRKLSLARDRIGEKPLYYSWENGAFGFASDVRALANGGFTSRGIELEAVQSYTQFGYVPCPLSIYKGVFKLPPGHLVSLDSAELVSAPHILASHPFWDSLSVCMDAAGARRSDLTDRQVVDELESLLLQSVKGQMISDVPLGAFLSGGIDSSTIVGLMQKLSSGRVKTFSIGFAEESYNEAQHAKRVAEHLGTDHTELYVTPADALSIIPKLPGIYGEPFADSSQIPVYLVSKLARQKVTVSLSGDGGDELFCGYNRYLWATKAWRIMEWAPRSFRALFAKTLNSVGHGAWENLYSFGRKFLPGLVPDVRQPGLKAQKLARILGVQDGMSLYSKLVTFWKDVVPGQPQRHPAWLGSCRKFSLLEDQMMYGDLVSYLPDDILVKVDRAAMSVSLETRAPFLDHRIVEFAWGLPLRFKVRDGVTKWALRQVLYKYVPRSLIDRPKSGFGVPIDFWLRGPLREWAEELLSTKALNDTGVFCERAVRSAWNEHLSEQGNWRDHLWIILMYQGWAKGLCSAGSVDQIAV